MTVPPGVFPTCLNPNLWFKESTCRLSATVEMFSSVSPNGPKARSNPSKALGIAAGMVGRIIHRPDSPHAPLML